MNRGLSQMNRRQFISSTSAAMIAPVLSQRIQAQAARARPKLLLFGMCVIQPGRPGAPLRAHLPALGRHAAFAVGDQRQVGAFWTAKPADQIYLANIHDDLQLSHVGCMRSGENQTLFATGGRETVFGSAVAGALPKLTELAKKIAPSHNYALNLPKGTPSVQLSGGELRLPYQTSRAVGTWGYGWRFRSGTREFGDTYRLTDLLVFESNTDSLTLRIGTKETALAMGEKMWLINIPTSMVEEINREDGKCEPIVDPRKEAECRNEIDDAHHFFEVLTNHEQLPADLNVKTFANFFRQDRIPGPPGHDPKHPCDDQATLAVTLRRYIPPDTDPCFATQV